MDQNGREVIAGLRHQQWLIGAPSVLLGKTYSFTVTTLSDCTLRCISAKNFIHLVKTHTEFSFQLTRILCQEIINHGNRLVMLGCIARAVKSTYKFFIQTIGITEQNQNSAACNLSAQPLVTPEHLSRLLKELETQGVIKREKDGLVLLDLFNIGQDCHS
jgi:CRP-like cAMP-binding protein